MSLKLKSGFTFDYDNLFGEGKVTKADIDAFSDKLKEAHKAMNVMRETGYIKGHLSKDGQPEKVWFSQCPYIQEGPLNSPESMKRLQDLRNSVRNRIDVVNQIFCTARVDIVATEIEFRITVSFFSGFAVPEFAALNVEQYFITEIGPADT